MSKGQKREIKVHKNNNWSFIFPGLSGLAGVGIGVVIGSFLGWI
jgi:hypothetical protein